MSGPLQAGHTRISSSFLSTSTLLKDSWYEIGEPRIGVCLDREDPAALVRKALAFYRIFCRHEDRQPVTKLEVRRRIRVMVRKRMLDDLHAQAPQMVEKPRGIADPGHGVRRAAAEGRDLGGFGARAQPGKARLNERHAQLSGLRLALGHDRMHVAQSAHRLAQRPGREAKPVAEA